MQVLEMTCVYKDRTEYEINRQKLFQNYQLEPIHFIITTDIEQNTVYIVTYSNSKLRVIVNNQKY